MEWLIACGFALFLYYAWSKNKKVSSQVITWGAISSSNEAINATQAKALYIEYMVKKRRMDIKKAKSHAVFFADHMRTKLRDLTYAFECEDKSYDLPNLVDQIATNSEDLDSEKSQLGHQDEPIDAERCAQLERWIARDRAAVASIEAASKKYKDNIKNFKADKRDFLVAYLNHQIHGHPMPD